MAARQLAGRRPLVLLVMSLSLGGRKKEERKNFFLSSFLRAPNLGGHLANPHQILPLCQRWPRFIKLGQKFGESLPNNVKFSARFRTSSRRDREYLRTNKISSMGTTGAKASFGFKYYQYYWKQCSRLSIQTISYTKIVKITAIRGNAFVSTLVLLRAARSPSRLGR